jgi:hypothetical protein
MDRDKERRELLRKQRAALTTNRKPKLYSQTLYTVRCVVNGSGARHLQTHLSDPTEARTGCRVTLLGVIDASRAVHAIPADAAPDSALAVRRSQLDL